MTALALGIDPEPLGVAPFIMSTAHAARRCSPTELGLDAAPRRPRSRCSRRSGAYVGGDIVAGMLATGMDRDKRIRLFIDVGTNCEIVLSDGDRILSTAAPAGPAFEGGAIRCGMRAADGAIEVVKLGDDDVELGVIGDVEPRGPVRLRPGRRGRRAGARSGCSTPAAGSSPTRSPRRSRPRWPTGSPTIGEERVFVLHRDAPRRRPGRVRRAVPARRPRAAVRQGRHLDRLDAAARGARPRAPRRPAGAARRLVRQLPLRRVGGPDRAGAEAAGAAHRRRRQRRRRGREDGAALDPRARRRRWRCWRR